MKCGLDWSDLDESIMQTGTKCKNLLKDISHKLDDFIALAKTTRHSLAFVDACVEHIVTVNTHRIMDIMIATNK